MCPFRALKWYGLFLQKEIGATLLRELCSLASFEQEKLRLRFIKANKRVKPSLLVAIGSDFIKRPEK